MSGERERMAVEAGEVPDWVLSALFEAAPAYADLGFGHNADKARDAWRQALAVALSAWEGKQRDLVPLMGGHDCAWRTLAVQPHVAMLGVKVTDALQRCDGCGDVRTQVLTGTWTLEQLRG
jgi:hypothetical protein